MPANSDNSEAVANPATQPRPYTLQRHRHPGALRQRPLAGAPGAGSDKGNKGHREAAGLSIASYCHKTTPADPAAPLLLTYYAGASLVDLQGPAARAVASAAAPPAKRQQIGEWSQSSRNRFRQFLSTLRHDALDQALVLTLTYPAEFPPPEKFSAYKNHLRVFNQALRRRFPTCSGVWKLEFQARGAAHFHLLCFGLPNDGLPALREWITSRWYAIAHNGDCHLGRAACELDPIKHHGGFINYLASYIAKNDQTRPGDFTGRYWGTFARTRLPTGEPHTLQLTQRQWFKVRRLARKKMEKDMERKRWSLFLKDKNPRQPAPGPEYGHITKGAAALGDRCWWEQLKSAHHGGCRRLHAMQWMPGEWREDADGNPVWLEPQFARSTSSTRLVNHCRPPSRYKARKLDRVKLICNAEGFVQALQRGIRQGLI